MEVDIKNILFSIRCRQINFYEQYQEYPRYIKVPYWLYRELSDYFRVLTGNIEKEDENLKLYGMLICDTCTIDKLNEIELF